MTASAVSPGAHAVASVGCMCRSGCWVTARRSAAKKDTALHGAVLLPVPAGVERDPAASCPWQHLELSPVSFWSCSWVTVVFQDCFVCISPMTGGADLSWVCVCVCVVLFNVSKPVQDQRVFLLQVLLSYLSALDSWPLWVCLCPHVGQLSLHSIERWFLPHCVIVMCLLFVRRSIRVGVGTLSKSGSSSVDLCLSS